MSDALTLIADDGPESLARLGERLAPHCVVPAARSGERALQLAMRLPQPQPQPIGPDVMMRGMNGREVLRRLRADAATGRAARPAAAVR